MTARGGPWPQQRRLAAHLREVLRRRFGCRDAWVVSSGGRCRLEVLVEGRRVVLLEDAEDAFWARFYQRVRIQRRRLGETVERTLLWRRPPRELADLLSPYWQARFGPPGGEGAPGA
ncbi:MAG: hypothetical protein QN173_05045 [Armatimonadota bacterium]|nr:hypothetical protein [Armatimonadota bacterium]MDR7401836.1 hypothetical protein [Armatimonadota bacterium]MDR7405096.1 hypothetical protein [Armatimonadota bacterium]MDR7437448.1 hypothetical protein [Armatimonadota bacterium]MDR7473199.1 hypothetical protein [Armatimonadota bacterium]